jgi:hypothetical protein
MFGPICGGVSAVGNPLGEGAVVKKILTLALLVIGACAPDITQNPPPSTNVVIVQFDPGNAAVPIVPVPNDLAINPATQKIVVPIPQGCPGAAPPASPLPATSTNGARDGSESDVDCGGQSGRACDADKACVIYEDCASAVCTGGKCVGGCPSDAQVEFNANYLGTLGGFPFESTATVQFSGEISPGSATPNTVLVIDFTSGAPVPVTDAGIQPAPKAINVLPPPKNWTRGHKYAVAILGGANGVKPADQAATLIPAQTWALVSSPNPLVTCQDLKTDCKPTVDIIPSDKQDADERFADQTAKAIQLEQIRRGYDVLLKMFEGAGKNRNDIYIVWSFSIIDAGEVTFDPAHNTVPFPNDLLTDPQTHKVQLPNPVTFKPLAPADCAAPTDAQVQLVCGLNTLDGFSTSAPLVSENSDTASAVAQANIDPNSLTRGAVGLEVLVSNAPAPEKTPVAWTPCLNCLSSPDANGNKQTSPQQLQWKLDAPLDEKTTYRAFVTTGVKDDKGKSVIANPVFALLQSSKPLAVNGKSTVPSLATDDQAAQLEQVRLSKALAGKPGDVLSFVFTTQSTATIQEQLVQLSSNPALGLPNSPTFTSDQTAAVKATATAGGIPIDAVGKVFVGSYLTPLAVTGPGGTLDPTKPVPEPVQFIASIPCDVATDGAGCKSPYPAAPPKYPVVIFGHGFTRSRADMVAIANTLATSGFVAIAPDHVWHGERTSCTGSALFLASVLPAGTNPTDDFACTTPGSPTAPDPVNAKCDGKLPIGRCVARNDASRNACNPATGPVADAICTGAGQGRCVAADSKCEGADFFRSQNPLDSGAPVISGLKSFNPGNFFETRDTFRQSSIDFGQLVRVLKGTAISTAPPAGLGVTLDPTKLAYVGQSLGGIYGALFNASSPDPQHVVLNVAGGALTTLFLESPRLEPLRKAFFAGLAAQKITVGTPAFDNFIGIAQWVLDPADPRNYGWQLTHGVSAPPPGDRKVFLQFIEKDDFVVNDANFALVTAANRNFVPTPPSFGCAPPLYCYEFTEAIDKFDTTSAPIPGRHGFLLAPPSRPDGVFITVKAQTQVGVFIATGSLP